MSFRKMGNITYVSIADTTAAAPTAAGIASPTTVTAGAVALVNEGNVILNAAAYTAMTSDARVRIVQNIAGKLFFTSAMTKGKLRMGVPAGGGTAPGSVAQYVAGAEQITAIGYNGTSGSLPSANSTSYYIKIRKNDNDAANRSQPFSIFAQFKTDASATQAELAFGLRINGVANVKNEPANKYLQFDVICDNAGVATVAGVGTVTATAGSRVITTSGATPATTLPIGSAIRLGTGLGDPIYKVTAVSNANQTVTVDTPVNISVVLTVGNAETISAVNVAAANCGVKMTGIASDFDVNAFRDWYVNRFSAFFSDDTTTVTSLQGATEGVNPWQKVAMDEYMSMGFQGQNEMLGVPPTMRTTSVTQGGATAEYDALMLTADEDIHGLTSANTETSSVILYLEEGSGSPSGIAVAAALGWSAVAGVDFT